MRHVARSALVPYTAREMFDLVDDVQAYPQFLPWCNDAVVHSRSDAVVEATLELHRGRVSHHFRTRNARRVAEAIDIALVSGPFRHLEGGWRFMAIGDEGSKVSLELDFEFEGRIADLVLGRFFEQTCNSLVDAFTKRAIQIFGQR